MKVLIVAYQFCPKGQVGTRRWSKFAKYLANKGYEVHVICAKYPYRDKMNWCHDVENNSNIVIHRLNANFPSFVLQPKRTFAVKLADRIAKKTLYRLDNAQMWGSSLIPFATKLIQKEQITNVMVTASPFMPMYFMAKVKDKLPNINLIIDIRDPWEMYLTDENRQRQADKYERYAFERADKVIFVTHHRREDAGKKYPKIEEKFITIYNGFDQADFKDLEPLSKNNFKVIYPGSLMRNRAVAIKLMVEAIHDLNDNHINEHLEVNLYSLNFQPPTFETEALQTIFEKHFHVRPIVSAREIFGVMNQHEFCMSINAQDKEHANTIGAKTFDYMGMNKKIILVAPEGELSQILRKQNQFVAEYSLESMKTTLLDMKKASLNTSNDVENQFRNFDITQLTEELEGLFSS